VNKTIRIWSATLGAAFLVALPPAAALGAQTSADAGDEYVVYVDALNLRPNLGRRRREGVAA